MSAPVPCVQRRTPNATHLPPLHAGRTAAIAVAATLAACSKGSSGSDGDGGVYFLNFKPESEQAFKDIAAAYTKRPV